MLSSPAKSPQNPRDLGPKSGSPGLLGSIETSRWVRSLDPDRSDPLCSGFPFLLAPDVPSPRAPPPRPPDVPAKVTVATSPCFRPALSHPGAPGDDGRGQDDHNIEGAQPKQAGDLINSWPSPLPARSPLICLRKGLAQRWQPSKYVWEFLL